MNSVEGKCDTLRANGIECGIGIPELDYSGESSRW